MMSESFDKMIKALISTLEDIQKLSEVDKNLALSYMIKRLEETLQSSEQKVSDVVED